MLPVLSEDRWLQSGQAMLLRQLGIDEEEAEGAEEQVPSSALADLLPWEYFQVLEQCFSFREILSLTSHEEEVERFFLDTLPLESVVTRLSTAFHQSPSGLLSPFLVHYLTSAWPYRFLVFQERLQRLLQDVFHYRRGDGVVQRWIQTMVKGDFWCPARYHQSPVAHIQAFADVYRETFQGLFPSESLHARHGQVLAHDRIVFEPAASLPCKECNRGQRIER